MSETQFNGTDITCFIQDEATQSMIQLALERIGLSQARMFEGNIDSAIKYFRSHLYTKIIVVDCAGESLITSKVEALLEVCGPDLILLVIGDKNEVSIFRDLIRLNVRDYLVKPLNADILNRALSVIIRGEERKKRTGKIICFMGTVGGCGTTTIALNVANIMSNHLAKKSLLIDTDMIFSTLPMNLDIKVSHGLREALEAPDRLDDAYLDQLLIVYGEQLKILNAEEPLYDYFAFDNPVLLRNFETLIDVLCERFHYVFFDVSRFKTPLWRMLARKAHHFYIISPLSLVGLRDTVRILAMLNEENLDGNHQIIINHTSERFMLKEKRFTQSVGQNILLSIPFDSTAMTATNLGVALSTHSSKYQRSLMPLIEHFIGGKVIGKQDAQGSFFENLIERLKLSSTAP